MAVFIYCIKYWQCKYQFGKANLCCLLYRMKDKVVGILFHHGGKLVLEPKAKYVGGKTKLEYLDCDRFSLPELFWYTRSFGYTTIAGIYYKPQNGGDFT